MKLFAVTGKPILFSKSPLIFSTAFQQDAKHDHRYIRLAADTADEAFSLASELGVTGFNITAPFKDAFRDHCQALSTDAAAIGAVNTLISHQTESTSTWTGYNTDPDGILYALQKHRTLTQDANHRAVILGNGGAARACIAACQRLGIPFSILARSSTLGATPFDAPQAATLFQAATIVLSTIPPTVALPESFTFHPNAILLDATYKTKSLLVERAEQQGICIASGLDWLLGQAIKNYTLFTQEQLSPNAISNIESSLRASMHPSHTSTFLIGLMGVGKSATLSALASLGYTTIDTDAEIERITGQSIAEIFATKGEQAFRETEFQVLQDARADFIACGGGMVTHAPSRAYLQAQGTCFWLWSGLDTLEERLKHDTSRPLLKERPLKQSLKDLLAQRIEFYADTAAVVIRSDTRTPTELAHRILYEINETR
jgi:shikimate 5-dehydrogenase/shikimate kinase